MEAIKILMSNGAKCDIKNNEGKTPGQVAIDENVQRILVSTATPGTKMFVHMSSSMLIQEIRKNGIPDFWLDTKKMQEAYSLEIKGWTKKVEWKQSTIPGTLKKIWKKSKIRPRLERSKKDRKQIEMPPNVLKCLKVSRSV